MSAPELVEYRVTFGPAHNPVWAEGWVSVMAPDEYAARARVIDEYGRAWAFIYGPGLLFEHLYPLGRMATLTAETGFCACGARLRFGRTACDVCLAKAAVEEVAR